jgi:hypothetical protein
MTAYDVKRFHSRRSVKKYRFFFFFLILKSWFRQY